MIENKEKKANIVAKAGMWYTICNFIFRGMAFITTPIFTRLLTKSEVGSFSNMSSWINILTVLTALDLHSSIIRSKLEHEDDIDSYIWSILSMSTFVTIILYVFVFIFQDFFIHLFQMEMKYINIMFIYLLLTPAYLMLITKQRAFFKYKFFVVLTGISIIFSTFSSLILVLFMNDKLFARFVGTYIPQIIIGIIIYIYLAYIGKKIKLKYWKYATFICLPLVPHVLSIYLLSASDKVIITKISGAEYTAIYSIAYSCYNIVTILYDSMNKAWAPWLLEALHYKKYVDIKKVSKIYIAIFFLISIAVLMFVPELIYILGGKQYMLAIYCLPPLITSCVFEFIYTMYVNIEFYKKKTMSVALATIIATILNIILNFIFIPIMPEYGYIIAAYTTLIGYGVLFVLHYYLVRFMNMAFVYDIKYIIMILISFIVISVIFNFLYSYTILRYMIIFIYTFSILIFIYKNKNKIVNILLKKS